MKYSAQAKPISWLAAQLENMAFLKLINLGKNEIEEGKFQDVDSFFVEMDAKG